MPIVCQAPSSMSDSETITGRKEDFSRSRTTGENDRGAACSHGKKDIRRVVHCSRDPAFHEGRVKE